MFSRLRKRRRSKSQAPIPRNEGDLMLRGMIEALGCSDDAMRKLEIRCNG